LFYCFECLEPLCEECTKQSRHINHHHDPLAEAFTKCRQEIGNKITELQDKRTNIENYRTDLSQNHPKLIEACPQRILQLK